MSLSEKLKGTAHRRTGASKKFRGESVLQREVLGRRDQGSPVSVGRCASVPLSL